MHFHKSFDYRQNYAVMFAANMKPSVFSQMFHSHTSNTNSLIISSTSIIKDNAQFVVTFYRKQASKSCIV